MPTKGDSVDKVGRGRGDETESLTYWTSNVLIEAPRT